MLQQNNQLRIFLLYGFVYSNLFTGVLRKWILPDFSSNLIIVPQIFSILLCVCFYRWIVFNIWEKAFFWCGVFVFFTTLLFGHQNLVVDIYGCLPYWFGLSSCAVLRHIVTRHDLKKICKIIVVTGIVNSVVCIIQFFSPALSIINTQNSFIDYLSLDREIAGSVIGFRASGIFMHSSQIPIFYSISFVILLYNLFINRFIKSWVCYLSIALEFISMPFFVARSNVMYHVGIALFFFIACYSKKIRKKLMYGLPLAFVGLALVFSTERGRQAVDVMSYRFSSAASSLYENSSTSEGTVHDIFDRNIMYNINALLNPITISGHDVPFWGYGQGMSTQIGGRLLGLTDNAGFALAEGDGLRIICESGFVLGWILIFIRVRYAFVYLFHIKEMKENGRMFSLSILPALLLAFFLSANWGNIYQANMAYMIAGLFFASLSWKDKTDKEKEEEALAQLQREMVGEPAGENAVSETEYGNKHSVVRGENPLA